MSKQTVIGSERDYIETGVLEVVSRYGGERVVAGPTMEALIHDLADFIEGRQWARTEAEPHE